jgi:hypothetical protein
LTTYKLIGLQACYRGSFTVAVCLCCQIETQEVLLVTPEQGIVFPAAEYIRDTVFRHCLAVEDSVIVVVDGTNVHHIDSTVAKVS